MVEVVVKYYVLSWSDSDNGRRSEEFRVIRLCVNMNDTENQGDQTHTFFRLGWRGTRFYLLPRWYFGKTNWRPPEVSTVNGRNVFTRWFLRDFVKNYAFGPWYSYYSYCSVKKTCEKNLAYFIWPICVRMCHRFVMYILPTAPLKPMPALEEPFRW